VWSFWNAVMLRDMRGGASEGKGDAFTLGSAPHRFCVEVWLHS
jgi:hypothetical protein